MEAFLLVVIVLFVLSLLLRDGDGIIQSGPLKNIMPWASEGLAIILIRNQEGVKCCLEQL